ncbi:hypothetical protein QTO34_018376, partial [Cnephaeus nilssonii]
MLPALPWGRTAQQSSRSLEAGRRCAVFGGNRCTLNRSRVLSAMLQCNKQGHTCLGIFTNLGESQCCIRSYLYWDAAKRGLDLRGFLKDLEMLQSVPSLSSMPVHTAHWNRHLCTSMCCLALYKVVPKINLSEEPRVI